MTDRKRRQHLAKCCRAFLCRAEWINDTAPKWTYVGARFGENFPIMAFEMWYVFGFSWKIVVIVVQSGLKLYDLTVIAAGVQANKFVIAPPLRTTLTTEPSCDIIGFYCDTIEVLTDQWVVKSRSVVFSTRRKLGHGEAFYKVLTLGAHSIAMKRNLSN